MKYSVNVPLDTLKNYNGISLIELFVIVIVFAILLINHGAFQ